MAITGSQKAYKYALSGVMRSGTSRSGYVSGNVFITIGGVPLVPSVPGAHTGIKLGSLTITDSLDEIPNTCTFRTINSVPTTGQEVIITLGSINNGDRLFAGHVLTVEEGILALPQQIYADVSCVDYTWQFGFQKVTKRYTGQSGTAIAQDLIATYAAVNGFTSAGITADLPGLDEITFTNEDLPDAFTRLARRLGAYWHIDYRKNVSLFFEDPRGRPSPVYMAHQSLRLDGFGYQTDRSQALTRVYVEGRGSTVLAPVNAGDTIIPVEAVDMFAVNTDVFLKASFQGSDGGAMHLDFTGVMPGGAGAIVGPGIGPSAAVTVTAQAGAGVDSGTHGYATTFVTASGESLPSPIASVTTGQVVDPPAAPGTPTTSATYESSGIAQFPIGHTLTFKYSYCTKVADTSSPISQFINAATLPSPPSASIVTIDNRDPFNPGRAAVVFVPIPYSPDPRVKSILVWVQDTPITGATFYRTGSVLVNNAAGGTLFARIQSVATTGGAAPSTNGTGTNQIAVSAIPVGAAAVTQRKLYRTAANLAQLKLLTTIANNTATTYLDTLADASLGANVPVTDTSALTQPSGSVFPGSTTIPVAGTSAFLPGGGWAIIGNGEQTIRYTGLTSSALTGIPASGNGSITAAVGYNSTITAAPMLTGIPASGTRAITRPLVPGDELYLVVQVDDTARQTSLAAVMGGTGIREEWVQDRRLSITEARARGQATLNVRPLDQATMQYRCQDITTAAGKTVEVNFTIGTASSLNIVAYLKIQQVIIDNFRHTPTQYPTYTVQASSTRFSFEDWLRRIPTRT